MNPNKNKGDRLEVAVVNYLNDLGIAAARMRAGWSDDHGDLEVPDWNCVVQCKNLNNVATALREGVDGATQQSINKGTPYGVAIVKRRGKPVEDAYVVMPLSVAAPLLKRGAL